MTFESDPKLSLKWPVQTRLIEISQPLEPSLDPKLTIGIGEAIAPENVISFALSSGMSQIIQRSSPELAKELEVSALMLHERRTFLDFPISSILDPNFAGKPREEELCLLKYDFTEQLQKMDMLNAIQEIIQDYSSSSRLRSDVFLIADELFTNAILHKSPRADDGSQFIDKAPTMLLGIDSQRLVIGCRDYHGSLPVNDVLKKVSRCYHQGVQKNINMGSGGAGIGSFMVFNTCLGYYVGVESGKQTVICCALPMKGSGTYRETVSKNLHFFHC